MRESELVDEVARRASVSRADAEAMLRGLTDTAREHLLEGDLCAVAVTFQAHAFTVDVARQRIREAGASVTGGRP